MPLYEHVFLARPDISAQQVNSLTESYKSIIGQYDGKVGKIEYWGLRPIAFRINKSKKAHYTMMNIDCSPEALAEMERQMGLSEDILRFMSLRVSKWEEGPSAMMSRNSRNDRRSPRESNDQGDDNTYEKTELEDEL